MNSKYLRNPEKRIIWSSWRDVQRSCPESDVTNEDDADSDYFEALLDDPDFLDDPEELAE